MPKPQKSITAITEMRFRELISAVEVSGSLKQSATALGIHWGTLHHHMKVRPDLAEELRHAQELGKRNLQAHLEALLLERIEAGSDVLLMFKLKQLDPSYRESYNVTTTNAPTTYVIDLGLPDDTPQLKDASTGKVLE